MPNNAVEDVVLVRPPDGNLMYLPHAEHAVTIIEAPLNAHLLIEQPPLVLDGGLLRWAYTEGLIDFLKTISGPP